MAGMMLKVLVLVIVLLAVDARSFRKNGKKRNEYKAAKPSEACFLAVHGCLRPINLYDSRNPEPCDIYHAASDCLLVAILDTTLCVVPSTMLENWKNIIQKFGEQHGCHK